MFLNPPYRKTIILIIFFVLAACSSASVGPEMVSITPAMTKTPIPTETSSIKPTEISFIPTATAIPKSTESAGNPCENMGMKYSYDEKLGEIIEEYIGSWHAAPFVGSGYTERFVFFPSGNYLFFPSQYECAPDDVAYVPSSVEDGIWGFTDSQINLAVGGDINNVRHISAGKVIDSSPDESPYPRKTTFDTIAYWLMSKDTNLWNPVTGELCE